MTTRVFGVSALILITAIALVAGMLVLDPLELDTLPSGERDPPTPLAQRDAPAPIIIVGLKIDVAPSSLTPLLIEVGPPQWVPIGSALHVQGLPSGIALSRGRRLSSDLWAIPVGDLVDLRIGAAPTAWGQSDLTLTLMGSDGSILAKARTAISINSPTAAAAHRADKVSLPVVSEQRIDLPSRPVTSEVLLADAERSAPAPAIEEDPSGTTAIFSAARETPVGSSELSRSSIASPPANPVAERDRDVAKTTSPAERNVADDPESAQLVRSDTQIVLSGSHGQLTDNKAGSAPGVTAKQETPKPLPVWIPAGNRSDGPEPSASEAQERQRHVAHGGERCLEEGANSTCARVHDLALRQGPPVHRAPGGRVKQTKSTGQFGWMRGILAIVYPPNKQPMVPASRRLAP